VSGARTFEEWASLGEAAARDLNYAEAIPAMRRALVLEPDADWLRVNFARALFALGHVSEAMRENEKAVHSMDAAVRGNAIRNAAIMAPGDPALDHAAILHLRRRWAAAASVGVKPVNAAPPRAGRIRLGYVGAFFDKPNWMKMYMGVINAHDRDRFEVSLIVDGAPPNATAGYRDHDEDRVWEVDGVPNDALASHIADAGIDILVNLCGFSHPPRMALPLYRAAPVQVAWNGMYATTGLPYIAALIGDASVVVAGEESAFTEPIRRVACTYLPFEIFYETPPVAKPPCLRNGHVTFGSLASAYKITGRTIATWCAALRAVTASRMIVGNRALDHASNRAELLGRFAAHGIAPDRVTLLGGAEHAAFLRSYDDMDIVLDSFPYNGGTSTAEALWQGAPVLTTIGDRWAGRTSRSILVAAGFAEDVAANEAGLVALAARRAADRPALAARRARQRGAVAASPACDPALLCRELEAIYADLLDTRRS
jgi:predicted O-linked N-acetylglucosamine transferase (SPINDLY family)